MKHQQNRLSIVQEVSNEVDTTTNVSSIVDKRPIFAPVENVDKSAKMLSGLQ